MEKKDDTPKEDGEEPAKKKVRWVKVVKKPAFHPTAAGVKVMQEHAKVHKKRDTTTTDVMKAVKRIGAKKTDLHLTKAAKTAKLLKIEPKGIKRLPASSCLIIR